MGSGSDGAVDRGPGTLAAKELYFLQNLQGTVEVDLLREGHFLGPGIGRVLGYFDFGYFFFEKNAFFYFVVFL